MELQSATFPYCKQHNTVELLACVFPNSAKTLSKLCTRKTSEKAVILNFCFLDALP